MHNYCQWWHFESRRRTCVLLWDVSCFIALKLLNILFYFQCTEAGRDLFEFPVTRTSEYSKVGKKGYLFEFDYETILFTFKNDAGSLEPILFHTLCLGLKAIFVCRCIHVSQITGQATTRERFVSIHWKDRRFVSLTVLPVLWIFISAAEHDAGLHPNKHLPKSHIIKYWWL